MRTKNFKITIDKKKFSFYNKTYIIVKKLNRKSDEGIGREPYWPPKK